MTANDGGPDHDTGNRKRLSRRSVLKTGAALGAASVLPLSASPAAAQVVPSSGGHSLDDLGWYELPIGDAKPAVMETAGTRDGAPYYYIEMAEGQHEHHPDMDPTTVWGYKGPNDSEGKFPGKTIDATRNQRLKVEFSNQLPDDHLFEVDDRVHGTKAAHYDRYEDWVSQFEGFGGSETFPEVRSVTHTHGLHVESASDGIPEQWTSPNGIVGPHFEKDVYDYPNSQPSATLWYHDHALGLTRLNVYAGLAGFYLIRGRDEHRLGLPSGDQEVPLLFQDRSFDADDEYKYPDEFAPEFGGDVSVVNGLAWPSFEVEPRQYRFRLLNGSNNRFFDIALENETSEAVEDDVPTIYQIGTDLGFLRDVVPIGPNQETKSLLLGPAERADVVVDFSNFAGETLTVTSDAGFPFVAPDADNNDGGGLSELAQFRVAEMDPKEPVVDPMELKLPGPDVYKEQAARTTRQMSLETTEVHNLDTHLLNEEGGRPGGDYWGDPVLTKPQLGTTEIWEIENNTPDAHPIHIHLVNFHVIGRSPPGTDSFQEPEPTERGNKDTVKINGGETVRIISRFGNFTGRYVWHCHILEHEDQEMMRPYEVVKGDSS